MISWEWATNLWATILLCPKVVSRIKRTGWLRVEDQYHVVGGEKATAIPYLSIVRKKIKRKLGGERLSAASFWMLLHKAESHSSHMRPLQGRKCSMQHWALLGGWEAKAEGRGWGWKLGKREVERWFLEVRVCTINRLALDVITGEHWEWKANGSWAVTACSEEAGQLPA